METPRHLLQKIRHGTFALFPLINTCWNQFGYIVSTFSPYGVDLATRFLVPFRPESCKKRCFRHLPFRENTIIMPQFLLSVLLGRRDVVSIPAHNGFAILSVVSCHFLCRSTVETMFFRKYQFANALVSIIFWFFCRAFAIKAIADIIKGVNYALYIGHSERRKFKLIINGIAEKMSRVSCIINPRSVPRRAIPQRHTFEAYITFSVRFYLLVNNQWFFLRPRMTDGQV